MNQPFAQNHFELFGIVPSYRIEPAALERGVMQLEGFSDDPNRSGEKILEVIQMTWIDEVD